MLLDDTAGNIMAANDVGVCTEAVKLNLISSNAVPTIRLTVAADTNMTVTTARTGE